MSSHYQKLKLVLTKILSPPLSPLSQLCLLHLLQVPTDAEYMSIYHTQLKGKCHIGKLY